jgi:hypothetical protein
LFVLFQGYSLPVEHVEFGEFSGFGWHGFEYSACGVAGDDFVVRP